MEGSMFLKCLKLVCFYMVSIRVWYRPGLSFSTITSLPGFSHSLPFKLETGYIAVGDVELFYYFIESERNPAEDPLMLWLTGGPGFSALSGLFFEIGPLQFNMVEYNGSLPTFALNPYSWTKVASIIFLDAPVGTGFSYSRTFIGFKTRDKKSADDVHNFLRKWLHSHPKFISNPLYIAGDSYSGKIVPIILKQYQTGLTDELVIYTLAASGIDQGRDDPAMNFKGYLLGNPATYMKHDDNSKIPFYHRTALISDELYESAKRNCKEEYVEVDISNVKCRKDLQTISECIVNVNKPHILEPACGNDLDQAGDSLDNNWRSLLETEEQDNLHMHVAAPKFPTFGCRNYNCYLCKGWASDSGVQKALNVRRGTVREWVRCNSSLHYEKDVESVIGYHGYLNTKGYRTLIYSGDHDRVVPYVGTELWIKSLNLSIVDDWRPWFVDGQVAGYSRGYGNNLTFATVKGGGHTAPEFKPRECLAMFKRWISQQRL